MQIPAWLGVSAAVAAAIVIVAASAGKWVDARSTSTPDRPELRLSLDLPDGVMPSCYFVDRGGETLALVQQGGPAIVIAEHNAGAAAKAAGPNDCMRAVAPLINVAFEAGPCMRPPPADAVPVTLGGIDGFASWVGEGPSEDRPGALPRDYVQCAFIVGDNSQRLLLTSVPADLYKDDVLSRVQLTVNAIEFEDDT